MMNIIETKNGEIATIPVVQKVRSITVIVVFFVILLLVYFVLTKKYSHFGGININSNKLFAIDDAPRPVILSGTNLEVYYNKDKDVIFDLSKISCVDAQGEAHELALISHVDNIYNYALIDSMVQGFIVEVDTNAPLFYLRVMRGNAPLWKIGVNGDGTNINSKKNNVYTINIYDEAFLNWNYNSIFYQ